mgnify:FL=1|jgi:hypothetical protein
MIDINDLWTVVAATKRQFLAIEFLDKTKVYLVESFAPKTRDVYFNEVRGAQDVTDLIEHMAFQMSQLNPISFEERIQGRSKKDFKFGHDNYMWLISNKENVY